jgi:hypothetical protein
MVAPNIAATLAGAANPVYMDGRLDLIAESAE